MPHIIVTYRPRLSLRGFSRRGVSLRTAEGIIDTLYNKACNLNLIPSESLDVYGRRLGPLDRQRKLVMVRIYADPNDYIPSLEEVDRIERAVWSLLSDQFNFLHIGVEVVTVPSASRVLH